MSLPRLLMGAGSEPMPWATHVALHGELPAAARRPVRGLGDSVLAEVTRAGLRGRGGGAFPLARKLESVLRARGRPVVVVNGTEGEPMSAKDRMLLESLPHLVLDGAFSLAAALGTADVVIAVDESAVGGSRAVRVALAARPDTGRGGIRAKVVAVPPGYVSGQETALVNFINNGVARPLTQPPRVSERGVGRRPTLISNAETLAHVALILRHGAEWFRQLGTREEPGSALVTLGGGVRGPGVYEIEYGTELRTLVTAAGGVSEPVRAVLLGGYAGRWIDAGPAATLGLSHLGLRGVGASLGAGIVVLLPRSACPVAEVARVAAWMSEESAGQCGPCVHGLGAIADALADIAEGTGRAAPLGDIHRWAQLATGRGACAHPDGAARFVTSALKIFSLEFDDHARHGRCEACDRRPVLSTPRPQAVAL